MNLLRPYILQPACEPDDYTYCQNRSAPFVRYKGRGNIVQCTKYKVQSRKYEIRSTELRKYQAARAKKREARTETQETRNKSQETRTKRHRLLLAFFASLRLCAKKKERDNR